MIVETIISWGFVDYLRTFFVANNLQVQCEIRDESFPVCQCVNLIYDEDSETALAITFMSMKHLGFENMLCDYLIRCGIPATLIPIGKEVKNRDMAQVEKDWQEHRKKIGLSR
jgi:hypothetical protein